MGDDPKPGEEAAGMTPEELERMNAALDAQIRRDQAERTRTGFSPGPPELLEELKEMTADELLARAAQEYQSRGRGHTRLLVSTYISRRLRDAGVSTDSIPPNDLFQVEKNLRVTLGENRRRLDEYISSTLDPFIGAAPKYKQDGHVEGITDPSIAQNQNNTVDFEGEGELTYYGLIEGFAARVEERLRNIGMSEADAARLAHNVVDDFENTARHPDRLKNPRQIEAAADLVVSTVRASGGSSASFGRAAKISLPSRAPAIWSNRTDRLEGENVVQFLRRVWGPYMDAGILYQDDIKRLGDAGLVPSVRAYCHQHGLTASSILPPPQKVRLERALAEAEPGSPAAALLEERLRKRTSVARKRSMQRQPA